MMAYLLIVLGQDALQWLWHLPHHCIGHWADFYDRFVANFQSLFDKPAQSWDLKYVRRKNDESLRSFLKCFQSMRNRIPDISNAAVIEDFYRGSHDVVFVCVILQKASTTSEQLFREADIYIIDDSELVPSSTNRGQHPQRSKGTLNKTSAGTRGRERKSIPWGRRKLGRVAPLAATTCGRWTKSSMVHVVITRTCAILYATAGISRTRSAMVDCSKRSLRHLLGGIKTYRLGCRGPGPTVPQH